jgi:hypothetical protein
MHIFGIREQFLISELMDKQKRNNNCVFISNDSILREGRHCGLLDKKVRVKSDLLVLNQIFGLFLGYFGFFWD